MHPKLSIHLRSGFVVLLLVQSALCCSVNAGEIGGAVVLSPGAYLSGGIGEEGRVAMLVERQHYSLRLTMALSGSGEYVSGAVVEIKREDKGGEVFGPYTDCGPLFYVRLPPGAYRVKASYAGETKEMRVQTTTRGVEQVMYWSTP